MSLEFEFEFEISNFSRYEIGFLEFLGILAFKKQFFF